MFEDEASMGLEKIEAHQDVDTCRACGSTNTVSLDLTKEYYLQALDVLAEVTYSGCQLIQVSVTERSNEKLRE
jgi:hypothetical protein